MIEPRTTLSRGERSTAEQPSSLFYSNINRFWLILRMYFIISYLLFLHVLHTCMGMWSSYFYMLPVVNAKRLTERLNSSTASHLMRYAFVINILLSYNKI